MAVTKPIISIKNMNVTYFAGKSNEVRALQNIELQINAGEFIIFFGPSGCGKSTLLYTIAGLERNVEGDIIVKGKNLSGMRNSELEIYHQHTIGMIFQSFYLISSLSIAENVALPQIGIRAAKADRTKKALGLLDKFGVGAQAKKLSSELSGGQQQRVAICRSLMNDPDILIADEPVGNLDSKSSQDVMDLLRHLNDVEKKTVILVTHDPSHLRHATRIFYLRDGKITGTKENTPEEREATAAASITALLTPTTLSHWAKAYTPTQNEQQKDQFATYKARQVIMEAMTTFTVEEYADIERRVHDFLQKEKIDHKSIAEFLHSPVKKGGIGMHLTKAKALSQQIDVLIREVTRVKRASDKFKEMDEEEMPLTLLEAREIRRIVLHALDIHLSGQQAVRAMDSAIQKRIEGTYDRIKLQEMLSTPVKKNGAGIHARLSRAASRRVDTLMIPIAPKKTSTQPPAPANEDE